MDWFPETILKKSEDEAQAKSAGGRRGSKFAVRRVGQYTQPQEGRSRVTTPPVDRKPGLPYLVDGAVVIPMNCHRRYRWWSGYGIPLENIVAETEGRACPVYTSVYTDEF